MQNKDEIVKRIAALSPEKRAALEKMLQKKKLTESLRPHRSRGTTNCFPLSFGQKRLWFLNQLEPDNPSYNILDILRIEGLLDVSALEKSINEIIRRHEVLRTVFATNEEDTPVQVIVPEQSVSLSVTDLQHQSAAEQNNEIQRACSEAAQRPFDLENGPLLKIRLLRLKDEEYLLLSAMHHIVCDGWSMGIFVRELMTLYENFSSQTERGKKIGFSLPDLPIQYADFACWQREWLSGEILARQLRYWKKQLAGSPSVLNLPRDFPRPATLTFRGAAESFEIENHLKKQLKFLSQQSGVTLFMTLLTGFAILLFRYSKEDDVLIGTPVANRNRKEIEPLIGFFVNTLVLRADLSGNPSYPELMQRIRQMTLDAFSHQDMPFEQLVESIQPERNLSRTPLFQVMFMLQNAPIQKLELPDLTINLLEREINTAQFDLTLEMRESESGLKGRFEYSTDLFRQETIRRMIGHFRTLLEGIIENPHQRISDLPLLTEAERHQLLVEFNDTEAEYPADKTVVDLFEAQVEKTPNHIAIVFEETEISYQELNKRANQIAHFLMETYRIQPDDRVGLLLDRSEQVVIGILGILKAGGAYVPMDPAYPAERIRHMKDDSGCKVILSEHKTWNALHLQANFEDIRQIRHDSLTNPKRPVQPHHLAYVIYTSGSTGIPKGVLIEHNSVVNMVFGLQQTLYKYLYKKNPARYDALPRKAIREALTASFVFDVSVQQIFSTLIQGNTLCIATDESRYDPRLLTDFAKEKHIDLIDITPGILSSLTEMGEEMPETVRHINLGAEKLPPGLIKKFYENEKYRHITLSNIYGPTESCVNATFLWIDSDFQLNSSTVPIGKPMPDIRIFILDAFMNPVPIGVPGEICIGGAGLARGYLNRDELTKEKFVPHPFRPGERLYRTGDLGRWLPDGNIEYLGRNDDQVKIRGYRIEPGEIENRLLSHEAVNEAVVVAGESENGNNELAAYLVSDAEINGNSLRDHLKKTLPDYMIPSCFVQMESLPLTPNGKIDKKALPAPAETRIMGSSEYVAPRNETEKNLANIWQEVLGCEKIGIRDNFFESGGHSLQAVRLANQIRKELGIEIALREIFSHPTVGEMAKLIPKNTRFYKIGQTPEPKGNSPLVIIQPHGENIPLFCVHPADGNVFCYAELARQLGTNQPFYALQYPDSTLFSSIEALASEYIESIQSVCPEGPCLLGGFSVGGVIAYEMAQQLRHQGRKIPVLILIDSFAPHFFESQEDEIEIFMGFAYAVGGRFKRDLIPFYCEIRGILPNQGITGIRKDLERLSHPERRLRILWECVQKAGIFTSEDIGIEYLERIFNVFSANSRAVSNYKIRPYSGRILLFRAIGEAATNHPDDPTLGWGTYAADLEVHDISEAHHYTLLTFPHVGIIAEKLKTLLC